MNLTKYKKDFPDDVLVTIEEFDKDSGLVIFDFFDSNEATSFLGIVSSSFSPGQASMVCLRNYWLKPIQENTIYSLKTQTLELLQQAINQNTLQNSYLIGLELDLSQVRINGQFFNQAVSPDPNDIFFLPWLSRNPLPIPLDPTHKRLSVTVRNVGQANWNELNSDEDVRLVFDVGAPTFAKIGEVRDLLGNRLLRYGKSKPGLIISHWDKDHYHGLIAMTDEELKCFSFAVFRDELPNLTTRILHGRIREALGKDRIFPISFINRQGRKGLPQFFPITDLKKNVVLFNSHYHKNRNVSGFAMIARGVSSSVIFSGDCHFSQISEYLLPHLNYPHQHNLIVPHHGGKAGPFRYILPFGVRPQNAIISVGVNPYGHPFDDYKTSLSLSKFTVSQTNIKDTDINITL